MDRAAKAYPKLNKLPLNRADCGHDRVFQVVSWCLLVGRASTAPGLADAVGLNATVLALAHEGP